MSYKKNVRILLILSLLGGCASVDGAVEDTRIKNLQTAQANFDAGQAAFEKGRYAEAINYYGVVQDKFPYSSLTGEAALKTADAYFEREEWSEAAQSYKLFARFYPQHPQMELAIFRTALAQFNDRPTELFEDDPKKNAFFRKILPVARPVERDMAIFKRIQRGLDDYIERYQTGTYIEKTRELRAHIRERLAEHDLLIAEYYLERDKQAAARVRFQQLVQEYGDTQIALKAEQHLKQIGADQQTLD